MIYIVSNTDVLVSKGGDPRYQTHDILHYTAKVVDTVNPKDLHRQLLKHSKRSKGVYPVEVDMSEDPLASAELSLDGINAAMQKFRLAETLNDQQRNENQAIGVGEESSNLAEDNRPASTTQHYRARNSDSGSEFEAVGSPSKKRKVEGGQDVHHNFEGTQIVPTIHDMPVSGNQLARRSEVSDNTHHSYAMDIQKMPLTSLSPQSSKASSGVTSVTKSAPKTRRWTGDGLLATAGSHLNKGLKE
ncbi:hypothetical protein CROQUDRAFT_135259 [Cronartium quercuum f. sp. fusiforme G11]|uniref:Uncharacterized protein n=1 Tax=Cronartium quercuum f. sp. fusiforme G11 TaxID=708437 RepID=A0A9P6NEU3_9BASI|nr:hypothetical protein CROQUDRAFT_135259 [Cronartium quercuum f. sp. fusiforme G11]